MGGGGGYIKPVSEAPGVVSVTEKRCILKIIMSEGGIEKDSAKNEGTDGCYRQVQVVFQLQEAC